MTTHLVTKHPRWSKPTWDIYAGTPVEVLDEQDVKGQTLVRLLAGPLTGSCIWAQADEIEQELEGTEARDADHLERGPEAERRPRSEAGV